MSDLTLATALELARWHGPALAAAFLSDLGVAPEVTEELLAKEKQLHPEASDSILIVKAQASYRC